MDYLNIYDGGRTLFYKMPQELDKMEILLAERANFQCHAQSPESRFTL